MFKKLVWVVICVAFFACSKSDKVDTAKEVEGYNVVLADVLSGLTDKLNETDFCAENEIKQASVNDALSFTVPGCFIGLSKERGKVTLAGAIVSGVEDASSLVFSFRDESKYYVLDAVIQDGNRLLEEEMDALFKGMVDFYSSSEESLVETVEKNISIVEGNNPLVDEQPDPISSEEIAEPSKIELNESGEVISIVEPVSPAIDPVEVIEPLEPIEQAETPSVE